jgi:hypothetical protein
MKKFIVRLTGKPQATISADYLNDENGIMEFVSVENEVSKSVAWVRLGPGDLIALEGSVEFFIP